MQHKKGKPLPQWEFSQFTSRCIAANYCMQKRANAVRSVCIAYYEILLSSENGLSRITPTILNRSGRNFTYVRDGAQIGRFPGNFARPQLRAAEMARKTELFRQGYKQRLRNAISQRPICVKFGHST